MNLRLRSAHHILVLFAIPFASTIPEVAEAQDLTVISATPANGSASVSLESTVAFEFSAPLDTSYRFPGGLPVEFFTISPPDSIVIDRVHYSTDLTTVLFDVSHTPDTDFLWLLSGARSSSDTLLCSPGVVNYTTAESTGEWSVRGTAYAVALVKRLRCGQFGALTALVYDKLPNNGGHPVAAATVDSNDDYLFSISGVRNGVYWPAVIADINENGVIEPNYPRLPELEVYRSLDYSPQNILVADADVDGVEMMIVVGLTTEERPTSGYSGNLSAYPNPLSDRTNVEVHLAQPGPIEVRVFDVLGRLQYRDVIPGGYAGPNTITLDLAMLPAGVYIGRIHLLGLAHDLLLLKRGSS